MINILLCEGILGVFPSVVMEWDVRTSRGIRTSIVKEMLVSLSGRVCNLRVGKPFITEKNEHVDYSSSSRAYETLN